MKHKQQPGLVIMIGTQPPEQDALGALAAADAVAKSTEVRVPTSAITIDGNAPADGDDVEFTVRGRAVRGEGPLTVIEPLEINGVPVPAPAAAEAADADAELTEAEVMAAMQQADEQGSV